MKTDYFILTGKNEPPVLRLLDIHSKLEVMKLNRKEYEELPRFVMLNMSSRAAGDFPDILAFPILMVSRAAMMEIRIYEPDMPYIAMALFDRLEKESAVYYCPVLEKGNLSCGSYLFRTEIRRQPRFLIHQELAESLLHRGITGMHLERLEQSRAV